MPRFDEIKVGDTAELQHSITKKDIEKFVDLTGDDNKLHIDADYASRTSFKKPVAHGMLGASFISTIIGTKLPGDGALWFSQSLEFLLPVRVGDEIIIKAEVLKKSEQLKTLEIRTEIFNQHRQKVTSGIAKVKVVEQEEPDEFSTTERRSHPVALVIGGSGGIGSAICQALAKDGFDIAVHYHSNESAAQRIGDSVIKAERRSMCVAGNINFELDVERIIHSVTRKLGKIDVLVNCSTAKIAPISFASLQWNDFEEHMNMAIKGMFFLVKHILPEMTSGGSIITIGSQYSEIPAPSLLPYITAKSALNGFNRALALELGPKGIRVNTVSPGMTDTDQISDVPERVRLMTAAKAPLRRLAKPEDVANAVVYLASDRSSYLTGETIRVNGGQVML